MRTVVFDGFSHDLVSDTVQEYLEASVLLAFDTCDRIVGGSCPTLLQIAPSMRSVRSSERVAVVRDIPRSNAVFQSVYEFCRVRLPYRRGRGIDTVLIRQLTATSALSEHGNRQ